MIATYYLSAILAIVAVGLALSARQAVHGLLYLLLGLISLAINLYAIGNEVGAVLLVIVYAGAIMVLFIFVVMLLNPSPTKKTDLPLSGLLRRFAGPVILGAVILAQLVVVALSDGTSAFVPTVFSAKDIAAALFQDGWVFVELLSLLITAALVGAFHIAKRPEP
jgi:NADH-quinone oxidoreductase subunit J